MESNWRRLAIAGFQETNAEEYKLHKRSVIVTVALFLLAHLVVAPAVQAGTISLSSKKEGGLLSGSASSKSAGKRKLSTNEQVVISNNILDLIAQTDFSEKKIPEGQSRLRGTVFNITSTPQRQKTKIGGYVFFDQGKDIATLGTTDGIDQVWLKDGGTIKGKIKKAGSQSLTITATSGDDQIIDSSGIDRISSSRIYAISLVVINGQVGADGALSGQAETISFSPTYSAGAGDQVSTKTKKPMPAARKFAIALVATLLIATAIAVPIAVAVGTSGGGRRQPMPLFLPPREEPPPPAPPPEP